MNTNAPAMPYQKIALRRQSKAVSLKTQSQRSDSHHRRLPQLRRGDIALVLFSKEKVRLEKRRRLESLISEHIDD